MLKKNLLLALLGMALVVTSFAQNIQLHYAPRHTLVEGEAPDLGKNNLISTVEMFRPDNYGSTFFFVDMAYGGEKGGVSSAYWEIARDLKFWKSPIAIHVEYNGGAVSGLPSAIPNAYLLGASYPFKLGKAFMITYVAYKYNAFKKTSHDAQWTATWNVNLLKNKITATGFIDVWTENKDRILGKGRKKCILMTQPQFWYNATKNLSVGTEIEISSDFYYDRKFYCLPTLAAKWQF